MVEGKEKGFEQTGLDDWRARLREAFAAAFGFPAGPLMTELLVFEAEKRSPLEELGVDLMASPHYRGFVPDNLVPFAETHGGEAFAFLVGDDPTLSSDARPIVKIAKDAPPCHVIAPNLAGFLSLLTISGEAEIARDTPDETYFALRREMLDAGDFSDTLLRATGLLCTLPGVLPPSSPSAITHAYPDIEFAEEPRADEPLVVTLPRVQELWAKGDAHAARRTLEALVTKWIDLGDMVAKSNWATLGGVLKEVEPELSEETWKALAPYVKLTSA